MARTDRLFRILQILRRRRRPITGQALAAELEVSLRTLYRDVAELVTQGVPVRGEAGTGYVLDPGYDMPPLMLTPDELEAAFLGAAWVAERGDPALTRAAQDLVAKLTFAVPKQLRPVLLDASLAAITFRKKAVDGVDLSLVRAAIRDQRKLTLSYEDAEGRATDRTVWPICLAYADDVRLLAAHCELRGDFRHFRTDRIRAARPEVASIPERRAPLRARWEATLHRRRASA